MIYDPIPSWWSVVCVRDGDVSAMMEVGFCRVGKCDGLSSSCLFICLKKYQYFYMYTVESNYIVMM